MILLFLDLPMDQESQCRTKSDDTGYGNDLLPVSDNNGLKDLTAQLEFQTYSKPLRQGDLHIRHPPHIIIKPFQTGESNNDHSDKFKEQYSHLDNIVHHVFQEFNDKLYVEHAQPPAFLTLLFSL